MKSVLVLSLIIAGTMGASVPASVSWVQPLDARPEALIIGATLLVVASVLRRGLPQKEGK